MYLPKEIIQNNPMNYASLGLHGAVHEGTLIRLLGTILRSEKVAPADEGCAIK